MKSDITSRMNDAPKDNFAAPEGVEPANEQMVSDPGRCERAGVLGLLLWAGCLMAVLVLIVWLVG